MALIPSQISQRVAARRKSLGLSRRALAEKVHVSAEAIRKIEVGLTESPGILLLSEIAEALDVDINYFVSADAQLPVSIEVGQTRASELRINLPFEIALSDEEMFNLKRRLTVEFEIIQDRVPSARSAQTPTEEGDNNG